MDSDELAVTTWDSYVGQEKMKARLAIEIEAAVEKERTLGHVLLAGPAGYGKSTMARIIAWALFDPLVELVMPVKPKVLIATLRDQPAGVLFLDEIHRCSEADQNALLPLLQNGFYQGVDGTLIEANLLTVIGATTEQQKLIPPLRDRFDLVPFFEPYTGAEMARIVVGMGERVGLRFEPDTAAGLGRASGGVPRMARRLVLSARSLVDTGRGASVAEILDQVGVDVDGLTETHFAYLRCLKQMSGSAGLATLTKMLQLSGSVLDDVERLLAERGMIRFASTGRELLSPGYAKLPSVAGRARPVVTL